MSKIFKLTFVLILCASLFSGCNGNRHLKDLLIVEGVAIDSENEENISLTLQALKIGMSNSSEIDDSNMTFNVSSKGKTISSSVSSLNKSLSKRSFFGHNKIIILSQKLVENDVENIMDYFIRSEDSRADIAICVSKNDARFILESKENDANVPSENILYLINNNEKSGQSILVNENEMLTLYQSKTSDIYLPVIERKNEKSNVNCDGIALFSDNKLSYITDDTQTKGFVVVKNKCRNVSFQINNEKYGKTDIKLTDFKCKNYASINEGKVYFNVDVKAKMIIDEIEPSIRDELDENDYKSLCLQAESACSDSIEKAFDACLYAQSDALRIGEYVSRDCPEYYDTYLSVGKNSLKQVKLNVKSSVKLGKISDNSQLE